MRSKTLPMLAGAGVLFSACILSVNPFYTEKDATFDPRLVGEWTTPDSKGSCRFEDAGDKKYRFTVTEQNGAEGKKGAFYACLFKLKENLFLDITPRKVKLREDQADMVGMTLIPGHLLIRVRQLEPTLKADFFDWDWLQNYLEKNPKALAHRRVGEDNKSLVLTATTRELQRFVLKHLKNAELFKIEPPDTGLVRGKIASPRAVTPAK